MNVAKSISLFLIDGTPDGNIACELFNWTGKGYRIPRNNLNEISNRRDLKKAGVYFLIGKDENDNDSVYIGETEEVIKRLFQHQEKDFWLEALVFISKDENLNKAHIKFLEFILHQQAVDAGRYIVTNLNTPYLNTLYVDKNLKYHGLIQAFSRTNRILNDTKLYGNILDFRGQQKEVRLWMS